MPDTESQLDVIDQLIIRRFEPDDQAAVSRLYTEGLLTGQIGPNDTGADIENIEHAYLEEPSNHFWVAEIQGQVVGMIGVAREDKHVAEIRRLRVERSDQATPLAAKLLETALSHCHQHGYLKVVLDTRFDSDAAIELFDRFGFQHTRTKPIAGKQLHEFYFDIYRQSNLDRQGQSVGGP